ncbi:MAG: hypothetical protein GF317_10695 [Candidatus Lokiarchaeota archaeon]|nr:hypothetical protein [Candidatus Lokiarchaeota archaeon]MBD3200129.1 hypothetical protein [Candidatus Lokiarchaeota archaeon]
MNVGFCGTGRIFNLNVLGYLQNKDTKITALCNRTVEKAKKKAEEFNLNDNINFYSDYRDMIKNEDLDIVEILLPNYLHSEVCNSCAKAGVRAISVQKPMATSLTEADRMIEICQETGTLLSIYENFYFADHIKKAKELIIEDYIGEPTSIRIKTVIGGSGGWKQEGTSDDWRSDPTKVGGDSEKGSPILFDNAWHAFALIKLFFNEKIKKMFAWHDFYHGLDVPAYVMFKFSEQEKHVVPQYGNMEFTYQPKMKIPSDYYSTDEFIEIIGTRGLMKINQGTSIGNLMTNSDAFAPVVVVRDGKVESFSNFKKDWKFSFINATKHFLKAAQGKVDPILSVHQAREILTYNLAAVKSATKGHEVRIKDI